MKLELLIVLTLLSVSVIAEDYYIQYGKSFSYCTPPWDINVAQFFSVGLISLGRILGGKLEIPVVIDPKIPSQTAHKITYDEKKNILCIGISSVEMWWNEQILMFSASSVVPNLINVTEFRFIVYEMPQVTSPLSYSVTEGMPLSIECAAKGYPNLAVELQSKIPEIPSVVGQGNQSSILLQLNATFVNLTDAFLCVARISVPNKTAIEPIRIDLQISPRITTRQVIVPTDIGVTETVTLIVEANPRGDMNCTLWNIDAPREVVWKALKTYTYEVSIRIKNVQLNQINEHVCFASNELGSDSVKVKLMVLPMNVTIVSLSAMSRYCNYYEVKWTANSGPRITSATVLVNTIGQSEPKKHDIDLPESQPGLVNKNAGWLRVISQHIPHLLNNSKHTITVQTVCNVYGCWNNSSPVQQSAVTTIETPPCNALNVAPDSIVEKLLNSGGAIFATPRNSKLIDTSDAPITTRYWMNLAILSSILSWCLWQ